jgi:signal transduction histidine kinase
MTMSLRTRLLLSYLLVIVTCIAVIALALLLLLRDAPVQRRLLTARLTIEAGVVQRLLRLPLQNGVPPDQLMRRIQNSGANLNGRVLLINEQTGEILADSDNQLTGRNLFRLGATDRLNNTLVGEFQLDGVRWLWSSRQGIDRAISTPEVVAAAEYDPTPSFSDPVFRELLQPMLIAGLLALIISIGLAALITRSVTRPMQHVARAAQKITAGDFNQTVPVEGSAEVKEMAGNFNRMAQTVRAAQQSQRDLLANVTHELKTPLTSIQGFAQAIRDGAAGEPAAVRRSASIIYDEAARMNRLVGELLDLARIESGQIVMRREPVPIDQVLRGVLERMALRAQQGEVALIDDVPDSLPAITGDGDRLAQVFGNLLDNALKHTPPGGKVTLSARLLSRSPAAKTGKLAPAGIEISVVDTGPGIPQEDLPRLFERFYQVDKSRARSGGSSLGLGLSIVKEIVNAHDGSIRVESVVGLGTRFVVTLPLERGNVA